MPITLRPYTPDDLDQILALSLRAWAPAFASWREVLGDRIFESAYPDWRETQSNAVRNTCTRLATTTQVAILDARLAGFAAVSISDSNTVRTGELDMIAVDPAAQRRGIGRTLLQASVDLMESAGCQIASIWTGGDPGHDPANALYRAAEFTPLPVTHYYRALQPPTSQPPSSRGVQ